MNRTLNIMPALAGAALPIVIDSSLKGALLIALAALALLVLPRASAAAKHLVWLFAVTALLALPCLAALLPGWRVLPAWTASERIPATPSHLPHLSQNEIASLPEAAPAPQGAPVAERFQSPPQLPPSPLAIRHWLVIAWATGFAFLLLRLLAAHFTLRRASRSCAVISDPRLIQIMEEARERLGLRRHITMLCDARRTIPMIWGYYQPRMLLPAEALHWDEGRLRSVVLHELAHVKRHDTATQWLIQLACALHWFNPFVWFAAWRLHVEGEQACDNLVLSTGVPASDYAGHLLHVATQLSSLPATTACGFAMARPSRVEGRLLAVLDGRANRRSVTGALMIAAFAIGLSILIPVAMLRAADDKNIRPVGMPAASTNSQPFLAEAEAKAAYEISAIQLRQAQEELRRLADLRGQKLISETEYSQAQYNAALWRAETQVRNASLAAATLPRAEAEFQRASQLYQQQLATREELDRTRAELNRLKNETNKVARAELELATIQASQARTNLARLAQLQDQNLVSQAERQRAHSELQAAVARLRVAQARQDASLNNQGSPYRSHSNPPPVDAPDSKLDAATAQAELEVAKADLKIASANLNRTADLVKKNLVSDAELQVAQAEVAKARARLRLAEVRHQVLSARGPAQSATAVDAGKKQRLREIVGEEIKLLEDQAKTILNRADKGVASQEEVMRADQELLSAKRKLAILDNNTAEARDLIDRQIRLLNDWRAIVEKRKEAGRISQEDDFKLRREILSLQRQRLELE